MNARTLAFVGVITLIGPGPVAAQEHKCACCAKGGSHDHAAAPQAPVSQPPAPTAAPHASVDAPAYEVGYEGVFAGVIYSVMRHPGMDVELTVGVGEKSFNVLVAPVGWLDSKGAVFRPGERVEIVGARWDRGSGDTIVAREIHTADHTVVVRNSDGRPLWNR
jgi:hypothetical protein